MAVAVAATGMVLAARPAMAQQTIGAVMNDTTDSITIFDGDTFAVLGTAPLPVQGATCCDVAISADQQWAFVVRFLTATTLTVFDISDPTAPTVAATLSTPTQGEDVTLIPGDDYLLISNGSAAASPISVVDISDPTAPVLASTISPGSDRNSVEACRDGESVLMTSFSGTTRRLTFDGAGNLADTGETLTTAQPNNVACAPDSESGVTVTRGAGGLQAFGVPGMVQSSQVTLPGTGLGISVVINNAGDTVFAQRGTNTVSAWDYSGGVLGTQIWANPIAGRPTFFGIDQIAIHPDDSMLFASTAGQVAVLDAATGTQVGSIPNSNPTGLAFRSGNIEEVVPPSVDPNRQLDCQVHLPILNFQGQDDICRSWIEVQYLGGGPDLPCIGAKAVLITWGEPGFCPPQAAGPLKVECTGMLLPGSTWNILGAQIPTGSKSGILFKFTAQQLSDVGLDDDLGFDDVVADLMCEELFFGVVGDADDYRRFKKAYNEGGTFRSIPQSTAMGTGALAVEVLRHCPGDVTPGVEVSSKYNGIAAAHLGSFDPIFGGFGYYVPLIYADHASLNTVMYIQNGGLECSSVEIWFKQQDDCLRARICEILTLAPGESYQFDATDCVGPDWQGSAWIRSSEPMGIAVDMFGRDIMMTYIGEPAPYYYVVGPEDDPEILEFNQGNRILYGPLMYSEYQGWDSGVQVQNLSEVVNAKVKVYFLDRSGDVITTLVDWICPRGSQTFYLPVVADLPGNWVGSIRVESQEWWTPGTYPVSPPYVVGVATLMKYNDVARTETIEALAYNLIPEHKAYTWQVGTGRGGTDSGVGLIAIPSLLKDPEGQGVISELAIMNLVAKPGFTDFAIYLFDQNGLLDFVCQKLHSRQVEYIDLSSWGYVNNGYKGSAIVSATFWEHDVFGPTGQFLRNLVGLGAVAIERSGTRLGEDIPGDEAAGSRGIPFANANKIEFCFQGDKPVCPGQPQFP